MFLCSASKGALDSFARSMAYNLALRVRVNTFLPGGIVTPGTESMAGDMEMLSEDPNISYY